MQQTIHNLSLDSLSPGLFRLAGNIIPPNEFAQGFMSVVVLGFARSGKSLLATKLREELGFSVFGLDRIRHAAYSRPATRRAYMDLLLRLYPRGLVIEGDNLVGENRSSAEILEPAEFQESVSFLQQKSIVVCVGSAETTVDEKTDAILGYRQSHNCWTTKAHYGLSQVRNLAKRSIGYSRQLRSMARTLNIEYFDLRPDFFELDIAASMSRIKELATIER